MTESFIKLVDVVDESNKKKAVVKPQYPFKVPEGSVQMRCWQ